jgi:hypothetical protein
VRSPEEYVGLDETEDGIWSVYFGPVLLGRFHELDYGEPAERVVTLRATSANGSKTEATRGLTQRRALQ